MHEMSKGANVGLAALSEDASSVFIGLSWSSAAGDGDADVSVLLLDAAGKVRSDADFYFYNHPAADDGSIQLLGKTPTENGSEDRISLDLTAVPEDVTSIVIAASQYSSATFGDLDDLRMTVSDRSGGALLGFSIADATVETAFIFGELYRRNAEWKFRAVGQGYETGLAGLATDFGIDVVEEDDAEVTEPESDHAPVAATSEPADAQPPAAAPAQAAPGVPPSGAATVAPASHERRRGPRRRRRRRSHSPAPRRSPSRRTTPGSRHASSPSPRTRAIESERYERPRSSFR